jgi:class 3 adenylate cyclase
VTEQPAGTVTFLFSDIENSTRLLQALGTDAYADVLDRHRLLLRQAFAAHGGYEVDCEGDQFIVAFQHAGEALAAAVDAQRLLAGEAWPGGRELRVRIGVHTGEPLLAPPKYVGLDVHRAARLMAAAHGGQILVSHATREVCAGDLPAGVGLRDLGEHQLKDLPSPERLYQLAVDGLRTEFPPPRTLTGLVDLRARRNRFARVAALLALAVGLLLIGPGEATGVVRGTNVLYTTNRDFGSGSLFGVDAATRDELGLTASEWTLRLLWLPRDFDAGVSSCTLVKIDSDTGTVLGEYRGVSQGDYCNSNQGSNFALIAVAPNGSAWHARTYSDPELCVTHHCGSANGRAVRGSARPIDEGVNGGPTQVGLAELDQCHDRNRNGRIDTSTALNDIRPWPGQSSLFTRAEDECILAHVEPAAYGVGGADRFLGVDRTGRLWLQDQNGRWLRFDAAAGAGETVDWPMPCSAVCHRRHGGRTAVTPDGDTWSGSPSAEGLHHDGAVMSDGNTFPTAVIVDEGGKPWIHESYLSRARRVDPAAGEFDLTVSLPSKHLVAGISGWMTAEVPLSRGATVGTWTVVQDGAAPGRAWRRVSWNGEPEGSVPARSRLTVEARAADAIADLDAQPYTQLANSAAADLTGRFVQVRATFRRSADGETPVLSDIRVQAAANSPPRAVDDAFSTNRGTPSTVRVLANDTDPDDDTLTVTDSTNGAHGTVHCVAAGTCTYTPDSEYAGGDSFTYAVSDGHRRGGRGTVSVTVTDVGADRRSR